MSEDVERTLSLGTLLVTPRGDGRYLKGAVKAVPLTLEAWLDVGSVERDADGKITFAYCMFHGKFDPKHWDVESQGDLYTDSGVADAVNNYLKSLGYTGSVDWSEYGRQEDKAADFDMDYSLVDEFWPDLKPVVAPSPGM